MPNPPGFYPFWFWNGRLSEDEIRWQIAEMADKGIRGFFIHPRQGLQQPYLSDAFFDMVAVAIDEAKQHGLFVHLYDEYPYPSGIAGGEVTEGNPHFQGTRLVQRSFDVPGGPIRQTLPRGHVLCCIAYPLDNDVVSWSHGIDLRSRIGMILVDESYNVAGLTQYNQKRYFASNPTPVLEASLDGPHRICVSIQAQVETHKYWGYYTDVLNPDAVRHYIDLTHERYYKRFGDEFGATIRSIFVDETQPNWSVRIPGDFRKHYGYDLIPLLPALQDSTHPEHKRVAFDLHCLLYHLFVDTYDKPMAAWCEKHGIAYSGEKHSMRLSQLKHMHIPGCDPGHTKAGAEELDTLTGDTRRSAKATASAAYFYEKEGALDECYHSLGWSGTIQDAKLIADMLILMGIRYLVPHGFFYTTHALKKHDAPPTFFFQMPYWSLWHYLSDHITELYEHFEGTHIPAEILLIDHATVLPTRDDVKTDNNIRNLLMENHLDFHIVDTDILESGHIENGCVCIKESAARCIICPPGRVVEDPLENWLNTFEQNGGTVLRVRRDGDLDELLLDILKTVRPHLNAQAKVGDIRKLQVVTRTDDDRTFWFLINTGKDDLHLIFDRPLREIPLDGLLPSRLHVNERILAPFESAILEATDTPEETPPLVHITLPVRGEAGITPKSKNLLRLYDWSMSLLDETHTVLQTETVPAVPIANQLDHGQFRIAPQIDMNFGIMPCLNMPELNVRYETTFECDYRGAVELILEPDSIVGNWTLRINNSEPIPPDAFSTTDAHVRGSLGLDITPYLTPGTNTLTVNLVTERLDGGLLNPLYLAGDFGILLNPVTLTEQADTGRFETYETNGLPFYAGIIEYQIPFTLDTLPDSETLLATLEFEQPFLEACEVSVNSSPWHPLLWSPYTFTLSRQDLNPGQNRLHIRVYTSLIRAFEGQRFNHHTHRYEGIHTIL